jgi:hypothetical protein
MVKYDDKRRLYHTTLRGETELQGITPDYDNTQFDISIVLSLMANRVNQ